MYTFWKLAAVEGKLFLREPMSVLFGVLFPAVILLGLGAIPALREPAPDFDGARFVDSWAPTALVLGIGILGLQHIPSVLATYRENGVLRRMSTTPVHPAKVLLAQLIVVLAAAVVAAVLLVFSASLILDVPLPRHPWWFAAAFVLGFGAVLALGTLIAAVAPNVRRERPGRVRVHGDDAPRRRVPAADLLAGVPGARRRLHTAGGAGTPRRLVQ